MRPRQPWPANIAQSPPGDGFKLFGGAAVKEITSLETSAVLSKLEPDAGVKKIDTTGRDQ